MSGRPLKFETAEELEKEIEKYFESCWTPKRDMFGGIVKDPETKEIIMTQSKPYTMSGLALALGTNRQTIKNYSEKDGFVDTIKRARAVCEAFAEEALFSSGKTGGAIFNLINNYGDWSNRQEHNHSSSDETKEAYLKHLQELTPNAQDE